MTILVPSADHSFRAVKLQEETVVFSCNAQYFREWAGEGYDELIDDETLVQAKVAR